MQIIVAPFNKMCVSKENHFRRNRIPYLVMAPLSRAPLIGCRPIDFKPYSDSFDNRIRFGPNQIPFR